MKATEKLFKDKDICIILETGANENQKLMDLSETLQVTRENKMKQIINEQY